MVSGEWRWRTVVVDDASTFCSPFATRYAPSKTNNKGRFPCVFSWSAPAPSAAISAAGCLQAGNDVTFLVRPSAPGARRAGLVIKSPNGDVTLKSPPTVQADKLNEKFDVVLLSCKAFDLEDAIKSFASAVGPNTAIIPLLNGMLHLDVLDDKFGASACSAVSARSPRRSTKSAKWCSSQPMQSLNFGERDGSMSERVKRDRRSFESGIVGAVASEHICRTCGRSGFSSSSLAASTSLMRTSVGNILAAPGGKDFLLGMLDEMQRDRQRVGLYAGRAVLPAHQRHADHRRLADDRLDVPRRQGGPAGRGRPCDRRSHRRADAAKVPVPKLRIAYTHLKAYEKQRAGKAWTISTASEL